VSDESLRAHQWKVEFYKDTDLTRQYIRDAIQNIKDGNIRLATERLEFISSHLNSFLSDYDRFIQEEREKFLD
jgi:hypothetical protein